MRRVKLADHDRNRLSRPIRGRGGFQSLLRRIAGGIEPATGVLEISEADAERGGPRNSDSLLRWDPDQGEGVWNATEATELSC